jgi:hypothetical protein
VYTLEEIMSAAALSFVGGCLYTFLFLYQPTQRIWRAYTGRMEERLKRR